jgi:hypothetical protein
MTIFRTLEGGVSPEQPGTTEPITPPQNNTCMSLSVDDLNTHLFKRANIIRDAVDPTDYKEYILPLSH